LRLAKVCRHRIEGSKPVGTAEGIVGAPTVCGIKSAGRNLPALSNPRLPP
jgi:hypothetical protein